MQPIQQFQGQVPSAMNFPMAEYLNAVNQASKTMMAGSQAMGEGIGKGVESVANAYGDYKKLQAETQAGAKKLEALIPIIQSPEAKEQILFALNQPDQSLRQRNQTIKEMLSVAGAYADQAFKVQQIQTEYGLKAAIEAQRQAAEKPNLGPLMESLSQISQPQPEEKPLIPMVVPATPMGEEAVKKEAASEIEFPADPFQKKEQEYRNKEKLTWSAVSQFIGSNPKLAEQAKVMADATLKSIGTPVKFDEANPYFKPMLAEVVDQTKKFEKSISTLDSVLKIFDKKKPEGVDQKTWDADIAREVQAMAKSVNEAFSGTSDAISATENKRIIPGLTDLKADFSNLFKVGRSVFNPNDLKLAKRTIEDLYNVNINRRNEMFNTIARASNPEIAERALSPTRHKPIESGVEVRAMVSRKEPGDRYLNPKSDTPKVKVDKLGQSSTPTGAGIMAGSPAVQQASKPVSTGTTTLSVGDLNKIPVRSNVVFTTGGNQTSIDVQRALRSKQASGASNTYGQ